MKTMNAKTAAARKQGGFTLIELTVVFLVTVVLAILAVPRIQSLILENKAPTVARDLQNAVARIRGARASLGNAPYVAATGSLVTIAELGSSLRNTSFTVVGGPPATGVNHGLGGGAAASPVTIGPVNLGGGAGSGFTVLLAGVDAAACVPLASTMSGVAEGMVIGAAAAVTAIGTAAGGKAPGGAFQSAAATTNCDVAAGVNMAFSFR